MSTLTKKMLVERIADRTGQTRVAVGESVQTLLDVVIESLSEGERLELRDFGVFEVKQRKPRIAQNPKTLEPVEVPSKPAVRFKAGRLMARRVEDAYAARGGQPGEAVLEALAEAQAASGVASNVASEVEPKRIDAQADAQTEAETKAQAPAAEAASKPASQLMQD